ncbi:MAG: hypothetical protein M1477_04760 [Candidatus Thermoplasmatota archaeon]|nr:hypothetical protein [Candidatus Thermoplasmatota archaeon]
MESIAAIDSFMIHTCKYSTASRRKLRGNYKDPESRWSKTTKGARYSYTSIFRRIREIKVREIMNPTSSVAMDSTGFKTAIRGRLAFQQMV